MIPEHGHLYVRYARTNFRNPMTAMFFLMLAYHGGTARAGMEMEPWRLDHRMDYVGQVRLFVHIARVWPGMTTDQWILG